MVKLSSLKKEYYKSGEVACMLGVTTRTIMLYDDNGQIAFEITATGRRIISKERLVKYLQDKDLLVNDMFRTKYDVVHLSRQIFKKI